VFFFSGGVNSSFFRKTGAMAGGTYSEIFTANQEKFTVLQ
jgi:hypothetical protein